MSGDAVYAAFGRCVAYARKHRGLTQADVADRIGLGRSSVANIEAGRQHAPLHVAVDLAWALDVPLDALLSESSLQVLLPPPPPCDTCHGAPPAGFACLACGTEAGR